MVRFPAAGTHPLDLARRALAAVCASAMLVPACGAASSAAADFPVRPIRLISPFAAGGGNDILSRTMANAITKDVGQSVVVDNRPGANTIIGMDIVAKAMPDGYTLIMTSSTQAINATLYPKLPFDSIRDFAPVCLIGSSPLVVAVPAPSSIKTVPQLIAAAKAKPGELTYPSAGTGNATHLAGALFASMAGVTLTHVPYKGSGPGITDLIAGRHAAVFSTAPSVLPHVKSGRLRALAVTSGTRSPNIPDLATVAESGLPGYEATTWYGIVTAAGTPRPIVMRLNAVIVKAIALPEVHTILTTQGVDPVGNSPDQFAAYLRSEITKWAGVIKTSGAKPGD
jgi:tripartite-type tricarboxylate transporter receptor subunit TctC